MLVSLIPELPLENPFQDATDRFYVARTGEDADRVAIVRRIWDEQFDVFKIVGRTESYRSLGNGESTTSRETVVHGSKDIDSMEQSDMMVSTDMLGCTQS
ncbi:unnamed protein product [Arabidopsis thaliana]|uniref:Uncharacterized protein n=1 Tax=Arabidopsis thaliana TaxID=3702 RepID=A0A654EVP7_ARATH|nr:unnamed protein product [Arabidopsis thaliana]